MSARICPHPEKKRYPSRRTAHRALRNLTRGPNSANGGPGRPHAYLCVDRSHWHIGHTTY